MRNGKHQCHNGSKLHTVPINNHLPAAQPTKWLRIFWGEKKKSRQWITGRKITRQKENKGKKRKRRYRKGESNDSPMIPDRRRTSDIPSLGLPSGDTQQHSNRQEYDKLTATKKFSKGPGAACQLLSWYNNTIKTSRDSTHSPSTLP